eukprot:6475076-Amphidinium_carterae.2
MSISLWQILWRTPCPVRAFARPSVVERVGFGELVLYYSGCLEKLRKAITGVGLRIDAVQSGMKVAPCYPIDHQSNQNTGFLNGHTAQ